MRLRWARGAAILVGGVVLGSVVSVAAQEPTPGPAQTPEPESNRDSRKGGPKHRMHRSGHGRHGAIRSTTVLPGMDGGPVRTVRIDRGELTAVDGSSITVREQDGMVVTVEASQDTRVRRDGSEVQLSDLRVGDHVTILRSKSGEEPYSTRGIKAFSPERQAEMEAQRRECEQDRTRCKRAPRGARPGPRPPEERTPAGTAGAVA